MRMLDRTFYAGDTVQVARALVGCDLVRRFDGQNLRGRIVETEAYVGPTDTACHAHKGRTARNEVMFGPPGHSYIYLVYGLHTMLNVVTGALDFPAAVLIRAVEPTQGIAIMRRLRGRPDPELTNGPGKLCRAFAIERSLNGIDLAQPREIWLETNTSPDPSQIAAGPRIGIHYAAEKDRRAPWRFWLKGNPFVSS